MEILLQDNELVYCMTSDFKEKYLLPVQAYVSWKLENDSWDDYNEFFHALRFFSSVRQEQNVWVHTHLILRQEEILGVVFILGGALSQIEQRYQIEEEDHALLVKYFHIREKGKGIGTDWFQKLLIPYYRNKRFKRIYLSSSHQQSFPFYQRLGTPIAEYESLSDNGQSLRKGRSFCILL